MSHYQTEQNLRGHIQKEHDLINSLVRIQIINRIDSLNFKNYQFVSVTILVAANCQRRDLIATSVIYFQTN